MTPVARLAAAHAARVAEANAASPVTTDETFKPYCDAVNDAALALFEAPSESARDLALKLDAIVEDFDWPALGPLADLLMAEIERLTGESAAHRRPDVARVGTGIASELIA